MMRRVRYGKRRTSGNQTIEERAVRKMKKKKKKKKKRKTDNSLKVTRAYGVHEAFFI